MEFSRQEYWSGLPFSSPGDLPDPGMEPGSPAFQGVNFPVCWASSWGRTREVGRRGKRGMGGWRLLQRKAAWLWVWERGSQKWNARSFPAGSGWAPGERVRVTRKGWPMSIACSLLLLTCQEPPMARWPGWGCGHLWMDGDHGKWWVNPHSYYLLSTSHSASSVLASRTWSVLKPLPGRQARTCQPEEETAKRTVWISRCQRGALGWILNPPDPQAYAQMACDGALLMLGRSQEQSPGCVSAIPSVGQHLNPSLRWETQRPVERKRQGPFSGGPGPLMPRGSKDAAAGPPPTEGKCNMLLTLCG